MDLVGSAFLLPSQQSLVQLLRSAEATIGSDPSGLYGVPSGSAFIYPAHIKKTLELFYHTPRYAWEFSHVGYQAY